MSSTQVIVRIAVVAAMKKKKKKATNRLQSRVTKKLNVNDLAHHLLKIAAVTIVTTVTEIVKEIEETGEIGITVMTDTVESKVAVKVALKVAANNELKVAANNELKVAVKVAVKVAAKVELKVAEKVELKVILTAIVTAIMIEGEAVGMTETDVMIVHVEETMTMIGDAVSEVAMSVHLSAKEVDLVTEVPLSKALELVAPLAGPLLVCQVKSVVL